VRHGFFADVGGVKVAPPDSEPFPVDSQQLAYLVKHKYLPMPQISTDDIRNVHKAEELARAVTFPSNGLVLSNLCGARSDARRALAARTNNAGIYLMRSAHLFPLVLQAAGFKLPVGAEHGHPGFAGARDVGAEEPYTWTPLDFVKPPPDPRSLIAPFWFGFGVVFGFGKEAGSRPVQNSANSKVIAAEGMGWGMMVYLIFFQIMYYGLYLAAAWTMSFPSKIEWYLWTVSNFTEFGLFAVYILALPLGTHVAPFIARNVFKARALSIWDVASMLSYWARLLVHGPLFLAYTVARIVVLTESIITLRTLPAVTYQDVNWSSFLPHI
jgi:hypothetical protein